MQARWAIVLVDSYYNVIFLKWMVIRVAVPVDFYNNIVLLELGAKLVIDSDYFDCIAVQLKWVAGWVIASGDYYYNIIMGGLVIGSKHFHCTAVQPKWGAK